MRRNAGLVCRQDLIHQGIRRPSQLVRFGDLHRQTAHVLDQRDAQGDRHRPYLADRQRLHGLIGLHKAQDKGFRQQTVGVRDIGPSQTQHPRIARKGAVDQFRQMSVIADRQIVFDLAQLLFDNVKVVQQPFGGGRDRLTGVQSLCTRPIGGKQGSGVVLDPADQTGHSHRAPPRHSLSGGQGQGMMLQTLDPEKIGPDRRGVGPKVGAWASPAPSGKERVQSHTAVTSSISGSGGSGKSPGGVAGGSSGPP